jgi:hypothetical protein
MSRPGNEGRAWHARSDSYASVLSGRPPRYSTDLSRSGTSSGGLGGLSYAAVSFPDQSRDSDTDDNGSSSRAPTSGHHHHRNHAHHQSRGLGDLGNAGPGGYGLNRPVRPLIPSYLHGSRYAEQLLESYKARLDAYESNLQAQNGEERTLSTSRSTNSSSANLARLSNGSNIADSVGSSSGSRWGVAYDVVEKMPPPTSNESLEGLPSIWNEHDKSSGLELMQDAMEIKFNASKVVERDAIAAAVRSDHPMPPQAGIYYYEITIVSKGKEGQIGIGFCSGKVSLDKLPGWEDNSWGYHGDDGKAFAAQGTSKVYGPLFGTGDVVGCGVNFRTGQAFFTRNGVNLGVAFSGLSKTLKLYPSVGLKKAGEHIRVNFGQQPFVFDIKSEIEKEKSFIENSLIPTDISSVLEQEIGYDEEESLRFLVGQYLSHHNYLRACQAFTEETKAETDPIQQLQQNKRLPYEMNLVDETKGEVRWKIRNAILVGDVDEAIKLTDTHFPGILEEKRLLYFRLRCLKFVELIRQWAEIGSSSNEAGSNGIDQESDDVEMEVDGDISRTNGFANGSSIDANGPSSYDSRKSSQASEHSHLKMKAKANTVSSAFPTPKDTYKKSQDDLMRERVLLYGREMKKEFLPSSSTAFSSHNVSHTNLSSLANASAAPQLPSINNNNNNSHLVADDQESREQQEVIRRKLQETWDLIRYEDPRQSPMGKTLMDVSERLPVAEGLNQAILGKSKLKHFHYFKTFEEKLDRLICFLFANIILSFTVSLGRSPVAGIDRLSRITDALAVELAADAGGPAGFLNVKSEFLSGRGLS